MSRDIKFWGLIGVVFLAVLSGFAAYTVLTAPLSIELKLGADQTNSEPFEMASAIAHVVGRSHPGIRIAVKSTGGSSQNMSLLAQGKLDIALVQADVISRGDVSLLAVLYPDLFQLLVREDSGISAIKDLEGRRIALPPVTSGQYRARRKTHPPAERGSADRRSTQYSIAAAVGSDRSAHPSRRRFAPPPDEENNKHMPHAEERP